MVFTRPIGNAIALPLKRKTSFLLQSNHRVKIFVENKNGIIQSQIRTLIALLRGENILLGTQPWAHKHFLFLFAVMLPWFFLALLSFLWFPNNYFIVPHFKVAHPPFPPCEHLWLRGRESATAVFVVLASQIRILKYFQF